MKKPVRDLGAILRQDIAILTKQRGWDMDYLHTMMTAWGYGDSLRKCTLQQLREIQSTMQNVGAVRPQAFNYDDQGAYMHSLLKSACWTEDRLRAYLIKRFSKSHWNILNQTERRGVINMLKSYVRKNINQQRSCK
jgi:hypothetical protein